MPLPRTKTSTDIRIVSETPEELLKISNIIDKDGFVYAGTKVRHISGGAVMCILGFYNYKIRQEPLDFFPF